MRILVLIFCFFISPHVFGDEDKHQQLVEDWCKTVMLVSESTMQLRQQGADIEDLLKIHEGNQFGAFEETAKKLVLMAYEYPIGITDEQKETIVKEFKSQSYIACIKEN